MRLALAIQRYFPFGGLQRDCRRLAEELVLRGHAVRLYCRSFEGNAIEGVELRRLPVRALTNHRRDARFIERLRADLAANPVDAVIGFDRMPGLDVYFAGDGCFLERARRERGALYRRTARFRHLATAEAAVFGTGSDTEVLLLSAAQADAYRRHYPGAAGRMHQLPPGLDAGRRAPADAPERRRRLREALGLAREDLALLFVASAFHTKGLDRAITALAHMATEQPSVSARLLVVGPGRPRRYRRLAKRLGVSEAVHFLGGREDVGDLMLAADLLVHPAREEAAGVVLLEALAAGLPQVVTESCGYAAHVKAARAGILLTGPFSQEKLDSAVMRNIDGVFRADCREGAQRYVQNTDLGSLHRQAAALIETLLAARRGGG